MFHIEIPRRSLFCASGKEKFEPGMEIYSALWKDESGHQFIRQDFCLDCWSAVIQEDVQSYWKSKVPLKKEESPLPKRRDERVFYLLREALLHDNRDEAFVLALYLARKRLLVLRQEMMHEKGHMILLYENSETEEIFCVQKCELSNLPKEKIQFDLAEKLRV